MENITNARNNPHHEPRRQLKKKYRYNDSLSKYKKTISNLVQKQKLNLNPNKFEPSLNNLDSGLTDISTEINEKAKTSNYTQFKKHDWASSKGLSLSAPKYHFLKSSTPKRDYNLKKKNIYINSPKTLNDSSYYKTSENFSQYIQTERNKLNDSILPKARNYSRPSYRSILSSEFTTSRKSGNFNDINNYTLTSTNIIKNNSNNKELLTLNNILQRQNKELRQNSREMRYKINELLNNIKVMRMDIQKLNNDKRKLLMKVTNLENELEMNKNMSFNELESRSNAITQLNEENMKLKVALDEKENEIINLKNNLNIINKNNKNYSNNIYKGNTNLINNVYDDDIKELDNNYNDDLNNQELRHYNFNELIHQVNILKKENEE